MVLRAFFRSNGNAAPVNMIVLGVWASPGLNGCGPAEASYMKHRTEGHTETTISGDTRADWSEAFALVPSLQIAYVWHASPMVVAPSLSYSSF